MKKEKKTNLTYLLRQHFTINFETKILHYILNQNLKLNYNIKCEYQ